MCRAINEDRTPNLIATQYDSSEWRIKNAILIPRFAFSLSAIEKRKPLAPSARRAGWVGCNILLCNIPEDVKIHLVKEGVPSNPRLVRRKFTELKPLSQFNVQIRGWALDVLNIASSLKQDKFSLGDIYKYEETFETLHPINQHIRPKIRQQLQKLRDLGIITFLGNGQYQFKTSSHPEC